MKRIVKGRWIVVTVAAVGVLLAQAAHAITGVANEIVIQNGTVGIVVPLGVAKGGTGATSFSSKGVLLAQGTSAVTDTGAGTANQVLVSGGAGVDPSFSAVNLASAAAVTGTLPTGNGGTGLAAASDDNLLVGNGTVWQSKLLNDCTGTGKAVTYVAASNTFGCNTISAGVTPLLTMSTLGDITQASTVFMSPGAVDGSEGRAQQIAPVATTFNNLRCVSSVAPGSAQTFTITMGDAACTGALSDSANQVCTISGTNRSCAAATSSEAVSAGECFRWKVVSSATAATAVVNCAVERSA